MKTSTVALIATGVLTTLGLGYLVYFDSQRRSNPEFRRQLRRERKKAVKEAKEAEKSSTESKLKLIERVIVECARENYPTSPEQKEKYFMEQVAAGEALCGQGPQYYDDAILPFYKALKVYPAPMELIMIYQKTIPEPVFQTIASILAIEQKAMEGQQTETPEAAAASATGVDIEVE
ncbi:mitochondrial outer membrane translocase complex, subunit Tom20 domain-containing protein [Gilbertella persicaria]|uniref:mitochondrial outer membrane translocase complex, subunit Tom20 domain-containing protein n=1 Tax=Gilbertella persicaria TaxID=101096 RepID=UPI00221EA60C|nr:mitochondrial outer membrane translocase complex, subunit Tom20 domain-containing protein [Gilbertella persicaria]KAI8087048.1 mitochondrial outer membrane translocase complex, subunit Tom20 domain-containing protein [Gilbertella persicaria]